ncbi:MAG: hypothetical protein ACYTEQ_05640 [Planctomycetota bacterium]|jgi:hypothetical protein
MGTQIVEPVDSFPYPNEHSARLRDPKRFNPKTYSRTAGGTLYGKVKVPATITIIQAKLKGRDKPSDRPIPQALRFPTKNWTADKARAWLKTNGVKYIRFEPAASPRKQQLIDFNSTDPASNPSIFEMHGPVEFAAADGEQEKTRVRLTLYDGSIVKHWYWGNLAFDLQTMRMAKKGPNPILYGHDTNQRLAYSTAADFDSSFTLEGNFLKSSALAEQVKKEADEGFPFEASLRFDPERSKIETVKEGELVEVNGRRLKGPGTVVRNAVIMEGSICVFGALKNTHSQVFLQNLGDETMDEKTELTAETFAAEYPELLEQIHSAAKAEGTAEGAKAERDRFGQIAALAADDPGFVVEQFKAGHSVEEAKTHLIERLRQQKEQAPASQKKSSVEAAKTEFSDGPTPKKGPDNLTGEQKWTAEFNRMTAEQKAEFGGDVEAYCAYRKAEEEGRVRVKSQ